MVFTEILKGTKEKKATQSTRVTFAFELPTGATPTDVVEAKNLIKTYVANSVKKHLPEDWQARTVNISDSDVLRCMLIAQEAINKTAKK